MRRKREGDEMKKIRGRKEEENRTKGEKGMKG